MPGAQRLVDAVLGVLALGLHGALAIVVDAAESADRRPGRGGAPGTAALPEAVVEQLLTAAESEGAWDSLLGRWGGLDRRGEQKIMPRRLQSSSMTQAVEADFYDMYLGFTRGKDCVEGLGIPPPLNKPVTDQLEPVKVAMRPEVWHRSNVWFLKIFLEEFYRVPVRLVPLKTDGSAAQEELLSGTVDLDIAAPVELPQDGDPLDERLINFGNLGYISWPGIYASPSLVAALNSSTPHMAVSQPSQTWFTSYRALASQALLALLPPVGPSMCNTSRCFVPTQCQGFSITGCRMLQQEDTMFGGNHTQTLLETHRLPLVLVYVSGDAWMSLVQNWTQLPPSLVASFNKPSSSPTLHRFQFPRSNVAGYSFTGTAQDWSPIAVKKLATRDLAYRLPDLVRGFLKNDFVRPDSVMGIGEAYMPLTPWFATPDQRFYMVACYEARPILRFLHSQCFRGDTFLCARRSRITCPPGQYPLQMDNRWYCTSCPAGTYCPPRAEAPHPCPNGTTSVPGQPSAADCLCMRGLRLALENGWLADVCSPCPGGQYKNTISNVQCNGRCPTHSWSEPGATSEVSCMCAEGFFLQSVKPWRCARCMAGAVCQGGIRANISTNLVEAELVEVWRNHTAPVSNPGFYGYELSTPMSANETYAPYFLPCPSHGACVGDNRCSASTTGDACRVCQQGFRRDLSSGRCIKCDNMASMLAIAIMRGLLEPLGQLILLRILVVASRDSAVLTPIVIKIMGLFFLATRTCLRSAVPSNGLRAPGGSVIRQLAEFLAQVIDYGSSGFEIDFTIVNLIQCLLGPDSADVTVSELRQTQIWNYRTRMIEVLLMPILWPISALVVILPFGLLTFNGDTSELPGQLSALKRMQILAHSERDARLHFAQVVVEDAKRKLVAKNSLAGVWRPFTYEWEAEAVAEERPEGVRRGFCLYLQSYTRNMVSFFMPFWFFHYLGLVKNCMKAVFSCNSHPGKGDTVEWWHGFEPALYCFSRDHREIAILGGIGLVVYGLGIPLLVCFVVRRKMKFSEEWCYSFNVNGYTFWGWITVYWDVVLLLRSAFLSFVESLPPETFQSQKALFAIIICAIGMVLQSAVKPFDARRNDTLNRLEASALATATLINPLLIAAVEYEQQNYEVAVQLCLLAFSLLIMRFLWRVLMELVREARDALIHFRKQSQFASMIRKKKERRQLTRQNQQKKWLREMLAQPKSRVASEVVSRQAHTKHQRTRRKVSAVSTSLTKTIKERVGQMCEHMVNNFNPGEDDGEGDDGWSDFSEEQPNEGIPHKKRRCSAHRCCRRCVRCLEDFIRWLGWSFLLSGMSVMRWVFQRLYHISRHREELQNRFGVVFIGGEEQGFKFEGARKIMMGQMSDLWQKEQVVSCFDAYLQCLLTQHDVPRLPANLPKAMLLEALNMGSTNKRSLRWKAMTQKVARLLHGICSVYLNTKQDAELVAGLHQLDSKMQRWLNFNDPSGRLVKVQHLEAYVLHSQFERRQTIIQFLKHAALIRSKPHEVDLFTDKDVAVQVFHDAETLAHRLTFKSNSCSGTMALHGRHSGAIDWVPTGQMANDVLYEGVPTTPSPSHLVEYWHTAHGVLCDDFFGTVTMYSFWDPLQDPHHPRALSEVPAKGEELEDPTRGSYTKLNIPGRPCDSALTSAVNFCEEAGNIAEMEPEPWPLEHTKNLLDTIVKSPFLDLRVQHVISRVHSPLAHRLLRILGKQHDMLRTCREGLTTQVVKITKQVEHCRERAARKGGFKSEVLDSAEGLVLAVGLRHGSQLFEQLCQRLDGGGGIWGAGQSWQQSHARWFAAAAREWMREFTARWTPWGVPVFSREEYILLHQLAGSTSVTIFSSPGMEDVNAWPMWKAMERREKNMHRARTDPTGTSGIRGASRVQHEGLAASIAGTPAGAMMLAEDWTAVEAQLQRSGGDSDAVAKQLWMVLEERRQIMLDWSYSVATRMFCAKPLQTTKSGCPYSYEVEDFSPGPPIEHHFSPRTASLATEDLRQDMERCRRAFGLSGFEGKEIVWCSRGLHELSPLHDLQVPTESSCDICDAVLGRDREGVTYCCLLCNRILCSSCTRLASFLSSGFDVTNLKPLDRSIGMDEAYRALDRMEMNDPCILMDEMSKLEGRLNMTVNYDGVEIHCRDILTWAQQRVLSGNSLLSVLLCRQGTHMLGFAPQIKGLSTCSICGLTMSKRTRGCGLCCNCDVFLCERCNDRVQYSEYVRSQIAHCWRDGVLDDDTRSRMCVHLKSSPLDVLDVLYRVLCMRDSDKARGWNRDLSLLVHRCMAWTDADGELTMQKKDEELEPEEQVVHRAVGPDKAEAQIKHQSQAVQVALGLQAATEASTPSLGTGHREEKQLAAAQEHVQVRRLDLQDVRRQPSGGPGTSQWAQGVTRGASSEDATPSRWRG